MLQELLSSSKENDPSQISTNQEKQIPTVTNCHGIVHNTDDFEQCPMPPTYNTESTKKLLKNYINIINCNFSTFLQSFDLKIISKQVKKANSGRDFDK